MPHPKDQKAPRQGTSQVSVLAFASQCVGDGGGMGVSKCYAATGKPGNNIEENRKTLVQSLGT